MRPLRRRGFSLIELVISIAIIATIAGVASVRFARSTERARVEAAAKHVASMIEDARSRARTNSTSCRVLVDTGTATVQLKWITSQNSELDSVSLDKPPYRVRVKTSGIVDGMVDFSSRGRPSAGGSISVDSGSFARTVTIDPETGHATVD